MNLSTFLPLFPCALAFAACSSSNSSSSGGPAATLDCAWLDSDNCWKTTAAATASCLPPSTAVGTLSADNKTCTYTTGQVVTFDSALTLPLGQNPTFSFTLTSGGATCLRFEQPAQSQLTMTTSAGTVTSLTSGESYTVTCPGGAAYTATEAQAISLLACDAGLLGGFPGDSFTSDTTSIQFTLLGTASESTPVFSCQSM